MSDKEVRIFDYFSPLDMSRHEDRLNPPTSHNYKSGLDTKLVQFNHIVRGDVIMTGYYNPNNLPTVDPLSGEQTGGELVVKVVIDYTYTASGRHSSRVVTRSWLLKDGTEHEEKKISEVDYNLDKKRQKGALSRRNENIIDKLSMAVIGFLVKNGSSEAAATASAQSFGVHHNESIGLFIRDTNDNIYTDIVTDTTHSWLNNLIDAENLPGVTIRMFLLNELNVWGL